MNSGRIQFLRYWCSSVPKLPWHTIQRTTGTSNVSGLKHIIKTLYLDRKTDIHQSKGCFTHKKNSWHLNYTIKHLCTTKPHNDLGMLVIHHRHAGNVNLMPFWIWMNPIISRQLFEPVLCHCIMSQTHACYYNNFRGLYHQASVKMWTHALSVSLTVYLPLICNFISTNCPAQKCNCHMCHQLWY